MNLEVLFSTRDLEKYQRRLRRREARQKFKSQPIEVSRAGGFCRARYKGQRDSVFGIDEQEALQRLSRFSTSGSFKPKYEDVQLDRAERRAERASARADYKSRNFNSGRHRAA
jgi:hypothetical protein